MTGGMALPLREVHSSMCSWVLHTYVQALRWAHTCPREEPGRSSRRQVLWKGERRSWTRAAQGCSQPLSYPTPPSSTEHTAEGTVARAGTMPGKESPRKMLCVVLATRLQA